MASNAPPRYRILTSRSQIRSTTTAILDAEHPLPALFVSGGPLYNWPFTRRNIQTTETYIISRLQTQSGTCLPEGSGILPATGPASAPDPSPSPSPGRLPSPVRCSDPTLCRSQSPFLGQSFGPASSPAPAPSLSFGDIELPRAHHSSSTHEPAHKYELDIGASTLQEINYDDASFEMAPVSNGGHIAITVDDLDLSNMESELNADTIGRITDGA
ncbi:uncharacterized protein FSUBG_13706 [Fusarium subglutinans]|uniref:Uncharacterized protein n=1 Tax=Gibberella subglutinans TaxID=42677 RepID=A0A8H5NVW3_GIBSU|nr:uncharacterized protein FSUBG_13706 [Fusarium subglutinans]KAF5578873.1 hypothetical protein FSUBG_13706 [Fusarium subglutinans]